MKKEAKKRMLWALLVLLLFGLWTTAVCLVDVQAIGPRRSEVGLAGLNKAVHALTGVHMTLYHITDWLGLVPVAVGFGFAGMGLAQWMHRKKLGQVDASILVLGGFYLVLLVAYLLFEKYPVNYRPVLMDGFLEASYPSSTTLLVLCVMPTAVLQWNQRMKHPVGKHLVRVCLSLFTVLMVLGRLLAGVHWFSDIVGGVLLSAGLVMMYDAAVKFFT